MARGRKRQVSGQKAAGIKRRPKEEETNKLAPLCPVITSPSVPIIVDVKQVLDAASQEERIESANFTGSSTLKNAPPPEASSSLFEVKTEVIDITDEAPQPYRCVLCEVPVGESDSLENLTGLCEERTGGHIAHFVLSAFWKLNEDQIQERLQQGSLSDFMWCCVQCSEKVRCRVILYTNQANGTMDKDRGCNVPEQCNNTSHQLKAHVNTHHKAHMPNVCDLCSLEFSDERLFHEHQLRLHDISPPYKMTLLCSVYGCGFRTVIKATLDKHMADVHWIQTDHECGICSKRFKNKRGLGRHMVIHKPAA